ncbi:hypothetical protein IQ07DRAFT_357767 [Pyrenochaeta sp. DS3sAY3a]|nr:hypothetical protein IQ07DRAFT_357767 [Pyrenochaeta sp. DS3sAY3a]
MATTTEHQIQQQHLPHSPPQSPPSSRNRHKKRLSSYQKLVATTLSSPPESPPNEPAEDESLLTRIILTPVLFTSFLLSLFVVNYRDRARRREAQTSHYSLIEYFYPSTWLNPEPYQDPGDSTWDSRAAAGHVEPNSAIAPKQGAQSVGGAKKQKSWHLNKKIRKVATLEISDAFEMRGRIVAGMVALVLCLPIAVWIGLRWLWAAFVGTRA